MTLEFCGLNCQLWKCSTLYHQMHYHGIPGETLGKNLVNYNTWCSQNGQTHVKNFAAFTTKFLTSVCPFCRQPGIIGLNIKRSDVVVHRHTTEKSYKKSR